MEKKKKKTVAIVASVLACVLLGCVIAVIVVPVTYDVDESLLVKNVDYGVRLVADQKYTTLTKAYKDENDTFKIVAFTDLHLDKYKKDGGNYSFNLMLRGILNEKPDLIVFTGDIVTGAFNGRRAKQLAKTLEEVGVYWTLCLGNHEHDNAFSITRAKMLKIFASYEHCLVDVSEKYTADGTKVWGVGNHVINILNQDGRISQSLYLLDGGQEMTAEDIEKYADGVSPAAAKAEYAKGEEAYRYEYDYVKESQIQWYRETVAAINTLNGSAVLSTVFDHIPVIEVEDAWRTITGEGYRVKDAYHEKTYDYSQETGNRLLYGERRETVCHSGYNSGLFDACLENGTQAMFFGHDHVNDCIMEYKGVILGYIKAGGYSTYNSLSKKYKKTVDGVETTVSLEDRLTYGYTVLSYAKDGSFTFESKENDTLYPELKTEIYKAIRKK